MKRLDLYHRSRGLQREADSRKPPGDGSVDKLRLLEEIGRQTGGEIVTRGGTTFLRIEENIPRSYRHGSVALDHAFADISEHLMTLFPILGRLDRSGISLHDMLFFDIETTGLSGGAGTYLFLAGFLSVVERGFNFRQYLLHSPSSERLYLSEIGKELMAQDFLVSYNGKSYDYNILKNRYIMTGLPFFYEEHVHLDLLYTSRRIWRGLFPDYSLSTVERRALQVMRRDDIPGWQIPDVYAGYLRGRRVTGDMLRILRHNREDVLSLLALLVKQMELIGGTAARDVQGSGFYNPITISDMLINGDRREQARTVLSVHSDSIEALRRLALMCKRELQFDQALKLLEDMRSRSVGLEDYIFACTEAAKIYEHRLRDYQKALRCTERMLRRIERAGHLAVCLDTEKERARILHRWKRIKRKLELWGQHT